MIEQYTLVLERKLVDDSNRPKQGTRLTFSLRMNGLKLVFAIGYLDRGDGSRNVLGDHMCEYLATVARAVVQRVLGETD